MDLFSKRLRKQQERSSLHARQLNKNATSLLLKQLHVLDRRQHQHARALTRSKQALLQELTEAEEPEHERPRDRSEGVLTSSRLVQKSLEQRQSSLAPSAFTPHKLCQDPPAEPTFPHPQGPSNGLWNSDMPSFLPGQHHHHHHHQQHHHHYHYHDDVKDQNSVQICRFRALSPLNPCPYFPCRRPVSYHRLKVSDVPDISPIRMDLERHQMKSSATDLHVDAASTSSLSDSGGTPGRAGPSLARGKDGPASPRTSINERLRGLRELVRELREKNEEKRPRDWAVNYGEPVSRRLLRKPVVPVSDE